MLKRLRWMTVGAGLGFGMSFWVVRAVRQRLQRYTPQGLKNDLRAAFAEGRVAMREREAQLRNQIKERTDPR
jgi:hypothetical protein